MEQRRTADDSQSEDYFTLLSLCITFLCVGFLVVLFVMTLQPADNPAKLGSFPVANIPQPGKLKHVDYDIQILFNESHFLKPFEHPRICKKFHKNCQKYDFLFMSNLALELSRTWPQSCYIFLEDDSHLCESDHILDELCLLNKDKQDLMVFGFGGSGFMLNKESLPRLIRRLNSVRESYAVDVAIGDAFKVSRFNRALYIENTGSASTIGNAGWDSEFKTCGKPHFDGGIAFWTHFDYKLDGASDFSPCNNCSQVTPYPHTVKHAPYGFGRNCKQFCRQQMRMNCTEDINYNSLDYLMGIKECNRIEYVNMFYKADKFRMPIIRIHKYSPDNFDPHDERMTCYWNEIYPYRCDMTGLVEKRICFCTPFDTP